MAASKKDKWSYCGVCKRNHEDGRKHIFLKHHKDKLSKILSKFSKKVRSARRCLGRPSVMDGELEPGAAGKMWCYCCEKEVQKHITNEHVSVEWGGLLEHMTESEHHKKTRRFWWLNGADSTQVQTFLIFPAEYRHFKELTLEALSQLEERNNERIKKLADDLKAKEEQRSLTALEASVSTSSGSIHKSKRSEKRVSWSAGIKSESFTSIKQKQIPGVKGNVHTGATPPWLRDDSCDDDTSSSKLALIGPSLEDFILHRETKKRAGRNPRRVGADFHIKLATQAQPDSDEWLPAFGRVWNHGPRFHSKQEFLSEVSSNDNPEQPVTKPPSTNPLVSPHHHPATELKPHISAQQVSHLPVLQPPFTNEHILSNELQVPDRTVSAPSSDTQRDSDIPVKPYVRKRLSVPPDLMLGISNLECVFNKPISSVEAELSNSQCLLHPLNSGGDLQTNEVESDETRLLEFSGQPRHDVEECAVKNKRPKLEISTVEASDQTIKPYVRRRIWNSNVHRYVMNT